MESRCLHPLGGTETPAEGVRGLLLRPVWGFEPEDFLGIVRLCLPWLFLSHDELDHPSDGAGEFILSGVGERQVHVGDMFHSQILGYHNHRQDTAFNRDGPDLLLVVPGLDDLVRSVFSHNESHEYLKVL